VASRTATVNQSVPDSPGGSALGSAVRSSVNIDENLLVENVEVIFNTSGGFGGNLEVILISPAGTESILARVQDVSFWNNRTVNIHGTAAVPVPLSGLFLMSILMGCVAVRRRHT
jgi:subtilisin-like proprotein convertase family protein